MKATIPQTPEVKSAFAVSFGRLVLAAACACGLWATAAHAEELRLLVYEGYAPPAMVEKFEQDMAKKYNVPVKVTQKSVNNADDFFPALRNNTADIISPSHNSPRNKKQPLFPLALPLDLARLPNYRHLNPSLQKLAFHSDNGAVYVVPILYGPYGLAYNTTKLPAPPKSWQALLDPAYVGNYVLAGDYPEVNIYVAALIAGVSKDDLGNFDKVSTPAVRDILKRLAAGANRFWLGVDKAADLKGLTLGTTWGFALPELKAQGEPWQLAWPVEGTTAYIDGLMVNRQVEKNPTLRALAEEWVNFAISEEAQLAYMRGLGVYPSSTLARKQASPEEVAAYSLDDPDFFKRTLILWPVLDERASNGFKTMWETAKKK